MKPPRLAFVFCLFQCFAALAQTTRPMPQVDRVLIISIDGLRPDVLMRANTRTLHGLIERGSFSLWAQTVPVAITLPSHVSMLTGVSVRKHGIDFNDERATTQPIYPRATTLFEVAHQAGLTTALVTGKSKFAVFTRPGVIDWAWTPENSKTTDAEVADMAGAIFRLHKPQVMFVHFPGGDTAGHAFGWDSPEQLSAYAGIDDAIGMILRGLDNSGLSQSTIVIVSADHGGSGRTHGANDPRSLYIPWIAAGPGVVQGQDLTRFRELTIHTEDTFATACYILGLTPPPGVDGKPILQIFPRKELLQDAPTTLPVGE
ncbi:MAG TPA: ectonucleotide pyrophosphatase/phosphodiesterase [Tepidisphaeraceae bacterium]|nr:ectonucleotide pyrophosphatase/phosphodiesterase [Tepidisphaeraceae bacterium]